MSGRVVVAEGTHSDGLTWVIWARRHEPRQGDLLSMIRVTDAAGRILHGDGRAGPPLPPGHVLNVSSGGSDEGPRTLLALLRRGCRGKVSRIVARSSPSHTTASRI